MSLPLNRKPILSLEVIAAPDCVRQLIVDRNVGNVPEQLTRATVGAAVRLARREAAPDEVLSEPVLYLVRHGLMAPDQNNCKSITALLLLQRGKEIGHGLRR